MNLSKNEMEDSKGLGELINRFLSENRLSASISMGAIGGTASLFSEDAQTIDYIMGCGGIGLTLDFIKNYGKEAYRKLRKNKDEKYGELLDITSTEYLDFISQVIASENAIGGELREIEYENIKEGGTSIDKGGHLGRAKFVFDDSNIYVVVKNSKKNISYSTAELHDQLSKRFSFVPKRYSAKEKEFVNKHPYLFGKDDNGQEINEPLIYSQLDSKPLDEIIDMNISEGAEDPFSGLDLKRHIDNMKEVYKNKSLVKYVPEDRFFKILKEKMQGEGEEFFSRYEQKRNEALKNLPHCVLHGDLNTGNMFEDGSIIDWDEAQIGNPYQDFFYFSAISGFENSVRYDDIKGYFMQNTKDFNINKRQKDHLEFEVYLRLSLRYSDSINEKTGKYFLDRCREKIEDMDEKELSNSFEDYVKRSDLSRLDSLDISEFDPCKDVFLSYKQNKNKSIDKSEENFSIDAEIASESKESRLSESSLLYSGGALAIGTSMLAIGGYYALTGELDDSAKQLIGECGLLGGLLYISNQIPDIINYKKKKSMS